MKRLRLFAVLLPLLLTLIPGPATAASTPQVVTSGKNIPWGLAFLPDGSALFSERTGGIWAVAPGRPARKIYTVTEARPNGEGGLLGIAVGPTYAADGRVYLYYSTGADNRIAFIRRGSAALPTPILTGIPVASTHNGGRLVFGPDGFLYAGTGDAQVSSRAQDTRSLGGKILRMTRDGKPVGTNPFGSVVFSYGHRNVQGLVFDRNRTLWATELGQNTSDEVNVVVSGGNYGWPTVEGRSSDTRFRNPAWTWTTDVASPSGIAIKGDSLYVAALRGRRVWRLRFSGTTISSQTAMFTSTFGRLRTIGQNPRDGAMWLTTTNRDRSGAASFDDRILRFTTFP